MTSNSTTHKSNKREFIEDVSHLYLTKIKSCRRDEEEIDVMK
jgi:hypothetical protein